MTHSFEETGLLRVQNSIRRFAKSHTVGIGVAEILAGGALLAYSYQDLGALFAAKEVAELLPEGIGIASGASGAGAMLLKVGGIGIAALGTAFSVPAGVVAGVGFVVLGALGYKVGDLLKEFMEPSWF